jgi:hypothetical protein
MRLAVFVQEPLQSKISEAVINEIPVSSVRRPCRSKTEAARQVTSHSNNAQITVFNLQS